MNTLNTSNTWQRRLLLIGIIFVAFNLRPAITALGPLVPSIRADIHISSSMAGFLTTLPLLAFAIISAVAPKMGHRLGNEMAIFVGLIGLTIGIGIRSVGSLEFLFIGTVFVGLGIAICNVLLPGIIKDRYPTKVGILTSIYSTSIGVFAALASGISVPLADSVGLGWNVSLLLWGVLSIGTAIIWVPQIRRKSKPLTVSDTGEMKQSLISSGLAWKVTFFMGLQSFLFYCSIAWLPAILEHQGMSITIAGWMLALMQFFGLPAMFITPIVASKVPDQRKIVGVIGAGYIIGLLGLLVDSHVSISVLAVIVFGFCQGASFSLAYSFFALRTTTAKQAADLSGMAQAFGYLLAAVGPTLLGFLFDQTGSWTWPLIALLAATGCMIAAGIGAGRADYVLKKSL